MPIRLSGMVSGMDTEAMVKELMAAHSIKKTKIEQKKTKLDWKQEKWADLNTKLYKLYTEQVSKLRLAGNYATKKVTSSNENIVTATSSTSAGSGSHTIAVKELASAQYLTGKAMEGLTSKSKLLELKYKDADGNEKAYFEKGTVIKVGAGKTEKTLEVTENTTVNDFVNLMKDAGLNASFDEKRGMFFISGKSSGKENAFTIETYKMDASLNGNLQDATKALTDLGLSNKQVSDYRALLEDLETKTKAYAEAKDKVSAGKAVEEAKAKLTTMEESFYKTAYNTTAKKEIIDERLNALKEAQENGTGTEEVKKAYEEIENAVEKSFYKVNEDGSREGLLDSVKDAIEADFRRQATEEANKIFAQNPDKIPTEQEIKDTIDAEYEKIWKSYGVKDGEAENVSEDAAIEKKVAELYNEALNSAVKNTANSYADTEEGKKLVEERAEAIENGSAAGKAEIDAKIKAAQEGYATAVKAYNDGFANATSGEKVNGRLAGLGLADVSLVDGKVKVDTSGGIQFTEARDAEIVLDGATLTGSSNSIEVGGVTYDLKGKTKEDETVTMNVTNNTQATFDMVKNFVTEYNKILLEMNTLYGAKSSKGYEPLTDEEREAMSDKQIELWENKIKDSLLRRDSTLDGLMTAMRSSLQTSVTVNGKSYSLGSFGIETGDYTEKGLLHIHGDADDPVYADKSNKLMKMLSENPEDVAAALSQITGKLYNTLQDKMKTSPVSSALTFYNDKEMKKQSTEYSKRISTWEVRLQEMETKYFNQFSAMEKAMAKLQSQSNYLGNLMGN